MILENNEEDIEEKEDGVSTRSKFLKKIKFNFYFYFYFFFKS
jgi:hypothetical protein